MAIINNNVLNNRFQLHKGMPGNINALIKYTQNRPEPKPLQSQAIIRYRPRENKAELVSPGGFAGFKMLQNSINEYYLVDCFPALTFTYTYKYQQAAMPELEMDISYTIKALAGKESMLVTALAKRHELEGNLHQYLVNWTTNAVLTRTSHILMDEFELSRVLNEELNISGGQIGLGISAIAKYKIDPEIIQAKILVAEKNIRVQPKGSGDFVTLSFDAVLKPDTTMAGSPYITLNYMAQGKFKQLLINSLQDYIRQRVNYNELITRLQDNVYTDLVQYWNDTMVQQKKGWLITELQLNYTDSLPEGYKFEQMDVAVTLINGKVNLVNTAILNLKNPTLFMKSRIPDLKEWVQEKLQQAAQNELAKVTYAELISNFKDIADRIKDNLNQQATQIGYTVEYLMTSDKLYTDRLSINFEFEEEEQHFSTDLNDKINLNIYVSGRIKSLNHSFWKEQLRPDSELDFSKEVKKEVLKYTRQFLLYVKAGEFYNDFNIRVAERLVRELKIILKDKFNIEDNVDIKPGGFDSAMMQALRELLKDIYVVKGGLFRDGVRYLINYKITGVDPEQWDLFAGLDYQNKEKIVGYVSDIIKTQVHNIFQMYVKSINIIQHPQFHLLLESVAKRTNIRVRNATGLEIDIKYVDITDNIMRDDFVKISLENAKEQLLNLAEQVKELTNRIDEAEMEESDDPEEIDKMKMKKKKLEEKMKTEQFSSYDLSVNGNIDLGPLIDRVNNLLLEDGTGDTEPDDQP